MKVKQIIAMIVVVALLMTGSVLVTMAYLTDTGSVTNVFTVGNIRMILEEADVNEKGEQLYAADGVTPLRTSDRNEYHLVPGRSYIKDPTVTIMENSDECYVRMMVTVNKYRQLKAAFPNFCGTIEKDGQKYENVFLLQNLVEGWNGEVWSCESISYNAAENTATYEFRYVGTESGTVAPTGDSATPLPALFEKVVIRGDVTKDQLKNLAKANDEDVDFTIDVVAHAMQADGFANADAAWEAFDGVTAP